MCVNISLRAHIVKSGLYSHCFDITETDRLYIPGPFMGGATSTSFVGMGGRQDAMRTLT